jgi:hypothetical protein
MVPGPRAHRPGQQHPLFDWLAQEATLPQMRWFLTQEAAGEAGFEDLLACTQVKLPPQPKLECARNFWDEMGHGKQSAMHGQMLEHMVRELGLRPASTPPCGSRWRWPTPWWAWRPRAATATTPSARSASSSSRPPAA